jgi:hypothetical protein
MKGLLGLGLLGLLCLAACSTGPADVAGNYTMAITNKDNGCMFQNYTVGATSTGVQVTVTQSSSQATATVMGGGGLILDAVLGGNAFSGKVDGDAIDLTLAGSRPNTMGNCVFTYNGEIIGSLSGDTLSGRLEYTAATNMNPDCTGIQGCITTQDFNGTRPPP